MNRLVLQQKAKSGVLVEKSIGDLLGMLDQIKNALKTTEELTGKAEVFGEKGRFEAVFSGISGKSDKELASLIQGLGANVKVTQEVVKFLIELSQHKSVVQEGFLQALDRKIDEQQGKLHQLGKNDGSLDENTKQVETAVLTLYRQVHAQVESEVELRKNVDQNMQNIGALYEELVLKGQTDTEQSEKIAKLIKAMHEKSYKLEEIRFSIEAKEKHLNELAEIVEKQSEKLSDLEHGLELKALKLEQSIGDIQANTTADKLREKRIIKLEAAIEALEQRKVSQVPAYIAMALAVVSVMGSVYFSF